MQKTNLIFLITIILSNFQHAQSYVVNEVSHKKQASTIIASHIYNEKTDELKICKEDLHLLLNLSYFSYLRSLTTLQAQDVAIKQLEVSWKGWQNIAHNRLDPSKPRPYEIKEEEKYYPDFWPLHDKHKTVGTSYTHAVNGIVEGDMLTTINAQTAVKEMRAQSRAVVAQALLSVKELLGSFFYEPQKKSGKSFSFLNHLWEYLPQLAMHSFVEANKLNDELSEEAWKAIFTMQTFGAETWEKIEEARASFYLALYKELFVVADNIFLEQEFRTILFDEVGIIRSGTFLPRV